MDMLILGRPDRKGMPGEPRAVALEVGWREAGKNITVTQEKHISKWEMSSKGHRDAMAMRTDKSPSVVVGRGSEDEFQCGRGERAVKKEKLYLQPDLSSSLAGKGRHQVRWLWLELGRLWEPQRSGSGD